MIVSILHSGIKKDSLISDGQQFHQYQQNEWVREWVNDCCLTPNQQFSAISWREQVNCQWNEDEVRFVLDQHA